MAESDQQVESHAVFANRRLMNAEGLAPDSPRLDGELAMAQVHASLAIAEQLERLNETLAAGNLTYADVMVRNA